MLVSAESTVSKVLGLTTWLMSTCIHSPAPSRWAALTISPASRIAARRISASCVSKIEAFDRSSRVNPG